ncbi:MAG: squalene synthase HpnD [Calditrichaeota bacterium]|nr:MAG: squalene synthase HpnD [Calditrichota bacterium]
MKTDSTDHHITLKSNSSFLYSFFFLPREKREAIYTLYAFCRQTDDIVDREGPIEKRLRQLNRWEKELTRCFVNRVSNYFDTLKQVAERFRIPFEHFLELIAGMRMDLCHLSYRSFEDLKLYCYRVASTVGLMCIQIFGYRDPEIREYAVNLGIALQLTNIIRDVGADARMGRVYLPQEELAHFQVSREDIFEQRYTPNFYRLMDFQARRAREYYRLAGEHLPPGERKNMLVSEIMKNIYWKLLHKIEQEHFRVLDRSVRLSTPTKVWTALSTASQIQFGLAR